VTTADAFLAALAVVLVGLAGLLACVETATARMSRPRVEKHVRDGRSGAVRLADVVADPPRYLNLLLLLRVAGEIGATAIVMVVAARSLDEYGNLSILVVAAVMTVVSYVGVGVAPRTLGAQHADAVALRFSWLTVGLTRIFGPLPRLLILIGNAITPGRGFREGPFASEAELRDLVDLAEERQVIEEGERAMIHSVFELSDTLAREVMVPRTEIVAIERGKTVRQAVNLLLRSGFSRVPVIGENTDDVVGVAYLKDLVRRSQADGGEEQKVEDVMRPASYVPDSKPVDELLREMQRDQNHIALVVDEYGGTAGLVTIEDILEEIVGEITDEYDRDVPAIEHLDDGSVRVPARMAVDEVGELFDVDLDVDGVDTVGGLLASQLGRVPIPGATAYVNGLVLVAESAKGRRNRIGTVLISRLEDHVAVAE
jgi:CBS domain containing-hemolysin-like protein